MLRFARFRTVPVGIGFALPAIVLVAIAACGEGGGDITTPDRVASALTALSGNDATAPAGEAIPDPVRLRVTDQHGDPLDGVPMTWTITAGGGALEGASAVTDAQGEAAARWTLGPGAAVNRLQVSAGELQPLLIEARSWVVSAVLVTFEEAGDSLGIQARLGDETLDDPELRVTSEQRWLDEIPVLTSDALERGILRARGPGEAIVAVRAFDIDMGTIGVAMRPPVPTVFEVDQPGWPGDPVVAIRGFRMDEVPSDAILIDGEPRAYLATDSAELRVDPGLVATEECVLSAEVALDVVNVPTYWSGTIRQPVETDDLQVGEVLTVEERTFCLRLPPGESANYALAQVDRVWVDHAATAPEPGFDTTTHAPHYFTIADRAAPLADEPRESAARAAIAPGTVGDGAVFDVLAPSAASDLFERDRPWEVGDTFSHWRPGEADPVQWEVVGLHAPNLVMAVGTDQLAEIWQDPYMPRFDSAFAAVGQSWVQDVLRNATGEETPVSSPGAGQLMVMVSFDIGAAGLASCCQVYLEPSLVGLSRDGLRSDIDPFLRALDVFGHELTHSWDFTNGGSGAKWATEGVAHLVKNELLRRHFDDPVDPNYDVDPWRTTFQDRGGWAKPPQKGLFNFGYYESASFLYQLVWRLTTEHGVPWDEALRAVARGSSEGWYGQRGGVGLTERVRQLGDPAWDPIDARLEWVLSTAADDRTGAAASSYRIPELREAGHWVESNAALRRDHDGPLGLYFYRGTIRSGSGEEVTGRSVSGANGYVLVDDAEGFGVALEGDVDIDTMVWRILRYR